VENQKSISRVFSGVQPTGDLHLGNYLGAVKKFVEFQSQNIETIYCLVDLHAITVWQDPKVLSQATRELTAAFLACGLDPKKSILFNQSRVSAHAELGWLFNCIARMGWLNRMTQFKDKAGKNRENASVGLFAYPNLMAADILTYHATHVPVGEDQKQHLELTRDIAAKFNNDFDAPNFFPLPEPVIQGAATRVMSLRDGKIKMSKSDPSQYSRINLTDSAELIEKKIKKAKTDPFTLPDDISQLENRPEAKNLLSIYAELESQGIEKTVSEFSGTDFSFFKSKLSDLAVEKLSPISKEITKLMNNQDFIDEVLRSGAEKASAIASPILQEAYRIVGLVNKAN
jgi:tryptophanyl-tRNA synthetase